MTDLLSATAAVIVLLALMLGVVATARPRRGGRGLRARTPGYLARYRVGEDRSPTAAVIIGSVAAASLTDVGMGMVTAPLIGCGLAMLRRPDPILDLLGACAALILLIASLSDTCGGTLRVLVLVMALGTFGGGLAVGRTLGVRGPGPGLALFGALDLARFAAAPLGAAWDVRELDSVVLVIAAVGVLGLIVGVAPRLSLILIAVAIAYAEIAIVPVTGSGPCASSSPDRAVTIAAFLIGYAAVRAVRTRSVN